MPQPSVKITDSGGAWWVSAQVPEPPLVSSLLMEVSAVAAVVVRSPVVRRDGRCRPSAATAEAPGWREISPANPGKFERGGVLAVSNHPQLKQSADTEVQEQGRGGPRATAAQRSTEDQNHGGGPKPGDGD